MARESLVLETWRAVGRCLDLRESFEQIGPLLLEALPASRALVRRLEPERMCLETLADAGRGAAQEDRAPALEDVGPELLADVVAWCRGGSVRRAEGPNIETFERALASKSVTGPALLGPLVGPGGSCGVLVVVLDHSRGRTAGFSAADERTVGRLLEPLAVALDNDRRLHELMRLREAVEADKQALLSKLDRQDISDSIIGAETGLRDVLLRVEQVAPTDAPVLILGETGAGKEVVARAIHGKSRRQSGPMVRVNCGAIPVELVDSELFGHERGGFTGAVNARKGWFERADGGTLFLDEVGELPLAAQVRLLRVLQDGIIERVGGHKSVSVDVRIIAATHRDLQSMVSRGTFREDLWYRISIFPLRLPPLRERLEDIPVLAAHFARRASKRLGVAPVTLSPDDVRLLVSYDWPGNVRELAAVIERAAILGSSHSNPLAASLGASSLVPGLRPQTTDARAATPPAKSAKLSSPQFEIRAQTQAQDLQAQARGQTQAQERLQSLDDAMSRHIEEALTRSHGRIEGPFGVANALGINPHTLRARMRKLGIDWRKFRG